jgi:hypothetical protein
MTFSLRKGKDVRGGLWRGDGEKTALPTSDGHAASVDFPFVGASAPW